MKHSKLIFYVTLSALLNIVTAGVITLNCNEVLGYYWRDYSGEIPSDAIPGGTDEKGKATYIGQTLHPGFSILPGIINAEKEKMFYEFGGSEHSSVEDVKILCSRQSENLQWISTENGEAIANLGKDNHLVLGGHDHSRPLAIGRKIISTGALTIGKVLTIDLKFELIYLANKGKGWSDPGPYEVLVYNPNLFIRQHDGCKSQVINVNISN